MRIESYNYSPTCREKLTDKLNYFRKPRKSEMMCEKRPTMHKRHASHIDRMQSEVHRANIAIDKMREEVVRLRSKNNDLREESSNLKPQPESLIAEGETTVQSRVGQSRAVRDHHSRGEDPPLIALQ
jgi:FtsZ-binding cell division protein ZapB